MPLVAEDVASQIQDFIIAQNLSEGSRLPSERDLAKILSTSRPTVSQAIRILVVKGLIQSRRGSGSYVTRRPQESLAASVNLMLDLDRDSVHHLNDLRLWLETMGIVQAIERGTDAEIAEGEAALEVLKDSIGDISAWMSADTHFHATLVRASHNPYLASIFESVHATLIEYEYRAWVDKGTVPKWLRKTEAAAVTALHEPILQAFKERNEEAGRIAVLHHHYVMAQHLIASHAQ
ncbi:FadR/GntR family transcriptional regulator [Polymorphum gilvum]|uniref:Transcriptional regulator, putative n=1 Tax=Polymorphum gilvum (strain LMG 25793 / CGMCC 1.9160 / SL003B-26A1) TaxID=991905 RepID=F2J2F9_POLGS|nr:FadR/GntR family transcriptional regulator [Polymorphum gilvum]ADZ70874.1 Transcriptional regulator, putative [Polymorphum gilvum SL003B-26A1]